LQSSIYVVILVIDNLYFDKIPQQERNVPRKEKFMDYFKDKLFELLNDADDMGICDIETNDRENTFQISLQSGMIVEVKCRQIK